MDARMRFRGYGLVLYGYGHVSFVNPLLLYLEYMMACLAEDILNK